MQHAKQKKLKTINDCANEELEADNKIMSYVYDRSKYFLLLYL